MPRNSDETLRNARRALNRSQERRTGGGSDMVPVRSGGAVQPLRSRSRSRTRSIGRRGRVLRMRHLMRKLLRILIALSVIAVGATIWGTFIAPLGFMGIVASVLLMMTAATVFAIFPQFEEPRGDELGDGALADLAGRTELWLAAQRPALPPPAQTLLDTIGVQLDVLGAQLAKVEAGNPAAQAARKLVAEELPGLISGYRAVPESMRGAPHHAGTPDDQLNSGLSTISREIDALNATLASGQLDQLATRQRYLEIKYSGQE